MESIINQQLEALIKGNHDTVANLANAAALIMQSWSQVSWAGFYRFRPQNNDLIVGPYQGKLACTRIKNGSGVCGTAAQSRKTQLVPDVNKFKGHIACDSDSQSEIVVPMIKNNQVKGVLDLDSNQLNRFSERDQKILERFVEILMKNQEA